MTPPPKPAPHLKTPPSPPDPAPDSSSPAADPYALRFFRSRGASDQHRRLRWMRAVTTQRRAVRRP